MNARGWRKISDWRNWRLPVKLGAVLLVPVAVAIGAGVLQIAGYVDRSNSYVQMQQLVRLRADIAPLVSSVQQERTLAAQSQTSGSGSSSYQNQITATDNAAATVRRRFDRTKGLTDVATSRFRELADQLGVLKGLREQTSSGTGDTTTTTTGYTGVVKSLLDFEQALISQFGDQAISGTAIAVHNVMIAQEQVSQQQAIVLAGIGRGKLLGTEVRSLEQTDIRLQDRFNDFQAIATPAQRRTYEETVTGPDVAARGKMVEKALTQPEQVPTSNKAGNNRQAEPTLGIGVDDWNKSSQVTVHAMEQVGAQLQNELAGTAARLQDETSDKAGGAAVVLLAMLILAVALGFVIGRYLLRSLEELRRSALDVAHHHLPEVVAAIRADRKPDTTIEPVPVHTVEEFGQLARAFDAVHEQAINSAVEQATLRGGMKNIFVNLSRRSQGLVERQLKLMEELERHEENPEQLANLFKLDHLATRMRRNNENLMVLSGTDVARRFTQPVPLADVLRAAASEIEQYQRVVVKSTPTVEVVGYAASDLVRLVAELLDNATAFSAPDTQVIIGARADRDGGVLVEVADQGIGMGPAELAEANDRLSSQTDDEVPVSRQMGLFVVGRLGKRHSVTVRLRAAEGREGLRAFVLVPSDLIRKNGAEEPVVPVPPKHAALPQPKPAHPKPAHPKPAQPKPALNTPPPEATPRVVVKTPNLAPPPEPTLPAPKSAPVQEETAHGWSSFRGVSIDMSSQDTPVETRIETDEETSSSSWFGAFGAPDDVPPQPSSTPSPAPPSPSVTGSWFGKNAGGSVFDEAESVVEDDGETGAGLPKRAPRKNLLPNLTERPGTQGAAPPRRDPERARGFLSSYQSGLRQAPLGGSGNGSGNGQRNGQE